MKRIGKWILILLLGILTLSSCTANHHSDNQRGPAMSVSVDGDGNTVYDGNEQLFYQVEEGQKAIVHFIITVEQGTIGFDIHEAEDESSHQYRGTITKSCEFDVVIEKASSYRIYVTASDFHGTYSLDWKTVPET